MLKKYLLTIIVTLSTLTILHGQDAFFSIPNGAFVYVNPAFSGTSGNLRFNNIYKNQYPLLSGNYNTNFLSVDHYYKNQGVGIYFLADQGGVSSLRKLEFTANYAYLTSLNENLSLSFGLGLGYGQSKLSLQNAVFEDQLQSDFSVSAVSQEQFEGSSSGYAEINSGLLLFGEKFWFGISGHHLNRPKVYSYLSNVTRMSRKMGVQLGYKQPIKSKRLINYNKELRDYILYGSDFAWQGQRIRTALWAKAFINSVVGTVSLSNIKTEQLGLRSIFVGAGYSHELFSFIYGYEFYFGNKVGVGGSHEIQLNINLPNHNKMSSHALLTKKTLKTFCPLK